MDIIVLGRLEQMDLVRRLQRKAKLGRRLLAGYLDGVDVEIAEQTKHALAIELYRDTSKYRK